MIGSGDYFVFVFWWEPTKCVRMGERPELVPSVSKRQLPQSNDSSTTDQHWLEGVSQHLIHAAAQHGVHHGALSIATHHDQVAAA